MPQDVELGYTRRGSLTRGKGNLEFYIPKKILCLLEEVLHVKFTKKQSNSKSCRKLGVTATSLFCRGKTLLEEEVYFSFLFLLLFYFSSQHQLARDVCGEGTSEGWQCCHQGPRPPR